MTRASFRTIMFRHIVCFNCDIPAEFRMKRLCPKSGEGCFYRATRFELQARRNEDADDHG